MGRGHSQIWSEFIKCTVNGRSGARCIHCNVFYNFINATKMEHHISHCIKCPANIKTKYLNKHMMKKKLSSLKSKSSLINDDGNEDLVTSVLHQNVESTFTASSVARVPKSVLDMNDCDTNDNNSVSGNSGLAEMVNDSVHSQSSSAIIKSQKLGHYFDSMNKSQKDDLDKHIAKAIYVTGAPLSMLEHPLWQKVFAACRPVYKIPTRSALSSTLLESQYSEMKKKVSEIVLSAPHLHLQCDGWTNIRNNGIMNFILSTPRPVFVKSVATGENRHTAEYISDEINKVLVEFNPMKFVTLIGDNAANVQKSFMLLNNLYPHLVPLNCLAHSINLLFNDIVSLQSLVNLKSDSLSIVKSINRSQILKACLENINKEQNILCSLKLPSPTRWASFFYCLESLNSTKFSLQILAVREPTLSAPIKKLLLDDSGFWENVDKCINLLKPMVKCITLLESDSPNIHKVYKYIMEIETCLNKSTDSSLLSLTDSSKMCVNFQRRKVNMIKPIHLAATVLDPCDQGTSLTPEEYIDASEFIYNISMARGLNANTIMSELANYKTKATGFWLKNYLWESANSMEPLVWWNGLCSFSILSSIATSILTAPTTSAATERSFSTYGNIHTKKRNKLTCDRAGKITYISHNWKLINNTPKPKTSKLISASSTLTTTTSQELNDMPMNIDENDYETGEDEDDSGDESFVIPYDDETSECESETEAEVEILTYDDLKT